MEAGSEQQDCRMLLPSELVLGMQVFGLRPSQAQGQWGWSWGLLGSHTPFLGAGSSLSRSEGLRSVCGDHSPTCVT